MDQEPGRTQIGLRTDGRQNSAGYRKGECTMKRKGSNGIRNATWRATAVFAAVALVASCELSPTNPGPSTDDTLDEPAAHGALVTGAARQLSLALNWLGHHSGAVTREITPSGLVGGGPFAVPERIRQGVLDTEETVDHWDLAHQARWIAEDAGRRMREVMGPEYDSYRHAGRAALYAGYANRLLGENMCQAVFDGGPAEDRMAYFERAESAFTEAHAIASAAADMEAVTAALAGRASVRAHLGDWSGAVADASAVGSGFAFHAVYSSLRQVEANAIALASEDSRRSTSVWNTFYEQYFLDSGDPRVAWDERPDFEFGGPAPEGQVIWYQQLKYTVLDAPVRLSSGPEMRLIEAEAALRDQDLDGAMSIINDLRAAAGVGPRSASDLAEGWTHLKRERGIELWLEGRRLGDYRRWTGDGVPGEGLDPLKGSDDCFPIPDSELQTNPNL